MSVKTAIEKQDITQEDGFDPDPLHSMTLGYLVNLIARLMAQALKTRNGPDGILPGQYPVALELLMRDGMSQRDLCEAVRIEQATMANTLKRMERDNLIVRRQSTEDGRLSTIHLTPRGRKLTRAAVDNVAEINRLALQGLDRHTQTELRDTLLALAERLDRDVCRRS